MLTLFALLATAFCPSLTQTRFQSVTDSPRQQTGHSPLAVAHVRCCDPRTRIDSLPYSISSSGSYVVVRHLVASSAADGITVNASGVTIDLNGFTLDGSDLGNIGIRLNSSDEVSVGNGTLRRWTVGGIDASAGRGSRFKDLHLEGFSPGSGFGLRLGQSCLAERCTLVSTGDFGIFLSGSNSLATDCVVSDSRLVGILATSDSTVRGCRVLANFGAGIRINGAPSILDNDVTGSVGNGIEALGSSGAIIDGNRLANNSVGIFVAASITVIGVTRNHATGSTPYVFPALSGIGPVSSSATATSPWANLVY